ncbi:MAG TPA: asparagine synthase-related protein [Thermoleophilaceae bacterium]|nr:asparagine synthase-related protein [Thermoleophilaceae bacterium]
MSAICGVVGLDGRPWTAADLNGVMCELAPLGRDLQGSWSGECGRCGVALGAALRHGTPEDLADHQPARAPDDSLVLVGDLRLDNRAELSASLGIADEVGVPDSRYALAAYERWGEACLDRILGAFAMAIVDRRRGGVLVARDHLGLRPLVVHERRGVVAFASTALSLTALDGVGHALDLRRAAEVLALAYDSERTFVEGVRWVPPGTALWVDGGGVRRRSWWRPEPVSGRDAGPPELYERELRETLDAAVGARLRAAGPVASVASGGIDSPSVAATAARLLAPRTLRTYTSVPPPGWTGPTRPNFDADETPLVRDLAAMHRNIDPSFVHVDPGGGLLDRHEELWELGAGPVRNPANMIWQRAVVERAASDGASVLLTGNRGNFFFSADAPDWLAALLRAGRPRRLLAELSAWTRTTGHGRSRVVRRHLVGPLAPASVRRIRRIVMGGADPVDEWLVSTALRPDAAAGLDLPSFLPRLDERGPHDVYARKLGAARVGGAQAETDAALEALLGVERRDPTADRRVIEAAMRQPEWLRRCDGRTRAIAREAMRDRLPASIVGRTRRGDQLPDWLDHLTGARAEIDAEVAAIADHGPSRDLIDVPRLRSLLESWPERGESATPSVLRDYRLALFRAMLVSRYLRWFEGRASAGRAVTGRDGRIPA